MRGQAHTLEGIIASVLLLTSLVFALQVTAVTPLSASTSSQQLENQQESVAEGTLAAADEMGSLKPAVAYGSDAADGSDDGRFAFHQTSGESFYSNGPPTNRFGELLENAFTTRGLAFNVYAQYRTSNGGTSRRRMVYQGEPSDNAVAANQMVTLYDDDVLYEPENDGNTSNFDVAQPTTTTLETAGDDFYAQDIDTSGPLFNVVEVRVVVWRQ